MNPAVVEIGALLTQARVLDVEGCQLKLEAGGHCFSAVLALPYPYRPQAGDLVLAAAQNDNAWVIGVIEGGGLTVFSAPADLELRAPRGRIVLNARDEVALKSRDVNFKADNLNAVAQNLTQQADNLDIDVKDRHLLRAGQSRTEVEETFTLRAEHVNARARKEVKIDGELINLG